MFLVQVTSAVVLHNWNNSVLVYLSYRDSVSWNIYPSSLFDFLYKIFMKLNFFPGSILIVDTERQLRDFLWHFFGSGRESGACAPKTNEGRGVWTAQINDLTLIRQLFQIMPRTFALSLCLLQRGSYLFSPPPSIRVFSFYKI